MDLFFDCVSKKDEPSYTIEEALEHVFSTPAFHGVLNMTVRGKVMCKVVCDARGAAVYHFRTLSGPFAVAEALYAPARTKLHGRCFYDGPPEPLPGSFELPEESRRKIVITFGPAPVAPSEQDDDDFEFL